MRVGIYLRVSTGEQHVENQRIDLQRVAEQRGWTVVEEYVDAGLSGARGREKRPEFDRLCQDASHGKLDLIAAWALDRIGRSSLHLAQFAAEMKAHKVGLYFYRQQLDTASPAGKLFYDVLAAIAEFEREILTERIHAGIARARKHGTKSGKPIGRPRARTSNVESRVRDLRTKGYGLVRIGRELGIGTGRCKRILDAQGVLA